MDNNQYVEEFKAFFPEGYIDIYDAIQIIKDKRPDINDPKNNIRQWLYDERLLCQGFSSHSGEMISIPKEVWGMYSIGGTIDPYNGENILSVQFFRAFQIDGKLTIISDRLNYKPLEGEAYIPIFPLIHLDSLTELIEHSAEIVSVSNKTDVARIPMSEWPEKFRITYDIFEGYYRQGVNFNEQPVKKLEFEIQSSLNRIDGDRSKGINSQNTVRSICQILRSPNLNRSKNKKTSSLKKE